MLKKEQITAVECPACGGKVTITKIKKWFSCDYCGSELVVDPHSSLGKVITLQSIVNIPEEIRLLNKQKNMLECKSREILRDIRRIESKSTNNFARVIFLPIMFFLIIIFGITLLANGVVSTRSVISTIFPFVPGFALLLHEAPLLQLLLTVLLIVSGIIGIYSQYELDRTPDKDLDSLNKELETVEGDKDTVTHKIIDLQKDLETYLKIYEKQLLR